MGRSLEWRRPLHCLGRRPSPPFRLLSLCPPFCQPVYDLFGPEILYLIRVDNNQSLKPERRIEDSGASAATQPSNCCFGAIPYRRKRNGLSCCRSMGPPHPRFYGRLSCGLRLRLKDCHFHIFSHLRSPRDRIGCHRNIPSRISLSTRENQHRGQRGSMED